MKSPSAIETICAGRDEDPDFRLVIEPDPKSGLLIYRSIDRRTNGVIWQMPREQLERLRRPAGTTGHGFKSGSGRASRLASAALAGEVGGSADEVVNG